MERSTVAVFLAGLGVGLSAAWVLEATLVGRGVVSTYLAPLAIGSVLASAFLRYRKR